MSDGFFILAGSHAFFLFKSGIENGFTVEPNRMQYLNYGHLILVIHKHLLGRVYPKGVQEIVEVGSVIPLNDQGGIALGHPDPLSEVRWRAC